ncbi:carbamate kinase [Parasporobacterium paucivorans]|uniref:Carbamate kinase n=1 Tax=Parasporobacterium paucivorans DSM 15970 TaxID=1122934 RepID=A0A1M6C7S4_9FIRM|nr:carbamate kinase [Parasporobacterium paucivorans]SHI56834.1 carbamate kinase [Parasporobacterium paucivorans DSM 15970]
MKKRIVIALGGNALGSSLAEQMIAVKKTSMAIAGLIAQGHDVVITHGNGPQVGMIQEAMDIFSDISPKHPRIPLTVCVAMSQAYIGYDLQNALREELINRGIDKSVSTVITQVLVDKDDSAFQNPVKPIGNILSQEELAAALGNNKPVLFEAGKGYRRVVASPRPIAVIEQGSINALLNAGEVVIACGGGGIPVVAEGRHLRGIPSVIDKDFSSCVLAQNIQAETLIILTAVEKVSIYFGSPHQVDLDSITTTQARKYMEEGHFGAGSMLPKITAAIEFAESGEHRVSLITLLEKASEGIAGKTGTRITKG